MENRRNRDGYPAGVPCWVDSSQPDPEAAVAFYSGLFGWECENAMPDDAPTKYYIARLGHDADRGTVGAIGSMPESAPDQAMWNTYIWVDEIDAILPTVTEAGGAVLVDPFDVGPAGRMAVLADPEGAAFCLWQARQNRGAEVVNISGAVNLNSLQTRDLDAVRSFYATVFGWHTVEIEGPASTWALAGYGDYLDENVSPGLLAMMEQMGAPTGFEDVVAGIDVIAEGDSSSHARWTVKFGVDDADATAARAVELGGTIVSPPTTIPWQRISVIADPQGAEFAIGQFVPPS